MKTFLKTVLITVALVSSLPITTLFAQEGFEKWSQFCHYPDAAFPRSVVSERAAVADRVGFHKAFFSSSQQAENSPSTMPAKKQKVYFYMPPNVVEGGKPGEAIVKFDHPEWASVRFFISADPVGVISTPKSVVIPAGKTTATFRFSIKNDSLQNLDREATVNLSIPEAGFEISNKSVIYDDEPLPRIVFIGDPGEAVETPNSYYEHSVKITLQKPVQDDGFISIRANPAEEVQLPGQAWFRKGQKTSYFGFDAFDDHKIDGKVRVTFIASAAGKKLAKCTGHMIDNESRQIGMVLPESIVEGGSAVGLITIAGTLPKPLKIELRRPNDGGLTMPDYVTIPSGETTIAFNISAPDNSLRDGTRSIEVSAIGSPLLAAARTVIVLDNEVAGFQFSAFNKILDVSVSQRITIFAVDIDGNRIMDFTGPVNLSALLASGKSEPLGPSSVRLVSGTWTGNVVLPSTPTVISGLRAEGSNGLAGVTGDFDSIRALGFDTADFLWDPVRGRIFASVPSAAGGQYANHIVAIDPNTLQVTGTIPLEHDPGQLVMTSDGEYIYAAMNDDGTIARIDPTKMEIVSTFKLGNDSWIGTMFAGDMCTVAGQPDVLVVSRRAKSLDSWQFGVAAYENGIIRPLVTEKYKRENSSIEPSADPGTFFGTGYDFKLTYLQLTEEGMTRLDKEAGSFMDSDGVTVPLAIQSRGNTIFSTVGAVVDGKEGICRGKFQASGPVAPEPEKGRAFCLEQVLPNDHYPKTFGSIAAYDLKTYAPVCRLSLPKPVSEPGNLVRWGSNGLIFSAGNRLMVVNSHRLMGSAPPADVAVTVRATPNNAAFGTSLTFTVTVTNHGPNVARNINLTAALSDGQELVSAESFHGAPLVSGMNASLLAGDLLPDQSCTMNIKVVALSYDHVDCGARVSSEAFDPDTLNNFGYKVVGQGFKAGMMVVNQVNLGANNMVYDSVRGLVWASVPGTGMNRPGRAVFSIDPKTGALSNPIDISGEPMAGTMALSGNGRYLYVGMSDLPDVCRIDLESPSREKTRMSVGTWQLGSPDYASDIEVIEGDGTAILVTKKFDRAALVIDGTVARPDRTANGIVDRIERTAHAGLFVGYDQKSGHPLSHISVTESGVQVVRTVGGVVTGYGTRMKGGGNLLLSEKGELCDSGSLTLKRVVPYRGAPCVDVGKSRYFILTANRRKQLGVIHAFNSLNNTSLGDLTLALPASATPDFEDTVPDFIQWGTDGFAILGKDGTIYFTRWALPYLVPASVRAVAGSMVAVTRPVATDSDGDGIPDVLENLFGTSPSEYTATPMKITGVTAGTKSTFHLAFPRRAGIAMPAYGYEFSSDLVVWAPVGDVSETVVSTLTVDGVEVENIDAAITAPPSKSGFVRLSWLQP